MQGTPSSRNICHVAAVVLEGEAQVEAERAQLGHRRAA